MTQPFRKGSDYVSTFWPDLKLRMLEDRIELTLGEELHTLSSAIWPGGFSQTRAFVNWKVPLHYDGNRPIQELKERLEGWGFAPDSTVGFMTAAKLTHASVIEIEGEGFRLFCCTTAGTRNAARAGLPRQTYSAYHAGTINTIVAIDGAMTDSALANAFITATEAKAAALQWLEIKEEANGGIATGTTTDALAIGATQRKLGDAVHAYAGAATTIGCAIGEAVYKTVLEAAATQHEV
ncbi:adenosylcobinamide amidohydrolase [Paenibacillus sp. GCM10027627]|uniref:adenosylcobinamide amidohydrolase n=1 Tax=unclassified Paenibacillus TaxID=185978 RepID=UPI0036253EB8